MGYDDGGCDLSPAGVHEFARDGLVVNARGRLDQLHVCVWCGVPAYEPTGSHEAARPPL